MYKQIIIVFCVVVIEVLGTEPQVYEDVDDQIQVESNTRVVRDPFAQPKPKLYKPPTYSPQVAQQDRRRFRYLQQQQSDLKNILRKNQEAPLRVSLVQDWKPIEPSAAATTNDDNYELPEETQTKPTISSTRKPITSRKMKPSSYYEDLDEAGNKQENNIKVRRSDYDFNALNALVGQNPNHQLEGLKRLLESPQTHFVLPLIKTPLPHSKPITEHVQDIPNPNTHPNVDTSPVSIDGLEQELDEATKAQIAQALADAQKQALAHVEAQHQAIAKAQEEAQRKALEQIALHNQATKHKPLALALQKEVVPVNLYAPSHDHKNQNQELVKANLKKISFTKTQQHQSPNAYQQVTLETQQKRKSLYPGLNQQEGGDNVDENHQYAARYAFGYKIRDVKMGNEYGHEEKRDGENAKGLYHVLLPDGRMQKVEYSAGPNGYHARVTYENLAHH